MNVRAAKPNIPSHDIVSCGRVVTCIWRGDITESNIVEAGLDLQRAHGEEPALVLIVLDSEAAMPNHAARQRLADALKQRSHAIQRLAIVLEQTGFRSAMTRAVITGIKMLASTELPIRIFSTLSEAVGFLTDEIFDAPDPELVLRTVQEARGVVHHGPTPQPEDDAIEIFFDLESLNDQQMGQVLRGLELIFGYELRLLPGAAIPSGSGGRPGKLPRTFEGRATP